MILLEEDTGAIAYNQDDIKEYFEYLDNQGIYHHKTYGFRHSWFLDYEKIIFPIVIISDMWDDPNGPYTYNHRYISIPNLLKQMNPAKLILDRFQQEDEAMTEDGTKKINI